MGEVNEIMLSKRIKSEDSMFVFFYEDDDIFAKRLLMFMEKVDNILDKKNIAFVKIRDDGIDKDYSIECLPALVHFSTGTQYPTLEISEKRTMLKSGLTKELNPRNKNPLN